MWLLLLISATVVDLRSIPCSHLSLPHCTILWSSSLGWLLADPATLVLGSCMFLSIAGWLVAMVVDLFLIWFNHRLRAFLIKGVKLELIR